MLSVEIIVGLAVGIVAIVFASFFGYKKYRSNKSSSQISKLSGALKSKQVQAEILMQSIA